jgi:uncharacterized membrane-anchored protein
MQNQIPTPGPSLRPVGGVTMRPLPAADNVNRDLHSEDRGSVFGELQIQALGPIVGPRRLLHFAFATDADAARADRTRLEQLCRSLGQATPPTDLRHHRVDLGAARLYWEQQNEFTSYTWEVAGAGAPLSSRPGARNAAMQHIEPPGPLLTATDLHIVPESAMVPVETIFGASSVGMAKVEGGSATIASDLRPDEEGFTRIAVSHENLSPARAGGLVQRLLEIETCRALALVGLPEAQRISPILKRIETTLTGVTYSMTHVRGPNADRSLLDELTALAANLEAEASASRDRFRASRAYDTLVQQRVATLGEVALAGHASVGSMLTRRLRQSMLSVEITEEKMAALSTRLERAIDLLRTRADVTIEHQNRDILNAMSDRSKLQQRMFQVVELIALAVVSYYAVALGAYILKAVNFFTPVVESDLVLAGLVPVVFALVWFVLRRIRKRASDTET